ncbi:MAG: sulfotransferase family 2 domain-containing protein, partial [Bacteroidetes bacterium]|nr:sulfotransferase family 2 domain-containing protein [Bacteroidota bacterium]
MPINHKYEIIFIHIPKTGGTSIESFFEMTQPDNFCFYRWDKDQIGFLEEHKGLSNSEKMNYEPQHYPLEVLKDLVKGYNNYFKFSFTRNPYTKLLSEYYWVNNKQFNSLNDFNPVEFNDWITS